MDGGSGLNIMYAKTLDEMGVDRTNLHPIRAPFHDIIPSRQAVPLGQIDLPVTFRDQSNYRTETLTFDVFMAIPNYTYLKLKMPGPHGNITVGTSFRCAYECEVECCGHTTAVIASEELAALKEEVVEEAPDAKRSPRSFKSMEGSKEVLVDPSSSEGKKVHIGTVLSSE
ncbi:uncharacterized protein [Miscanthus floridulus]|uniref:uncharacterized protein n=1 Tax=Miscanthus floridulus TaxID=154761 RepID=UPI003457BE6B